MDRRMAHEPDLTGNDHISLPVVTPDGGIDRITVLHAGMAGLIEWAGDGATPLLQLRVRVDGSPVPLRDATWRRLDRWIPTFTLTTADGLTVTGTICAPAGYPAARGFLVRLEAENRGRAPVEVAAELDLAWGWSRHWIASGRPLPGANTLAVDGSGGGLILESDGGRGPALAILAGHPATLSAASADGATGDPQPHAGDDSATAATDRGVSAANGVVVRAGVAQTVALERGRRAVRAFFVGAGRERDGAVAAAAILRRTGADAWLRQTRLELSHILRPAQDPRRAELLNRNLLFNRYFAIGRGIDDDRLHLLRSRSPLCPAPALFNDREALLWTLPALIIADPGLAREAMFRVFETFSERSGEHRRYLDGGAFDPGFSLDQFLLYPWLADHYAAATGDDTVLDDPLVGQIVHETDAGAFMRLHPEHLAAHTELLPGGEPADYPYPTTANVLLHAFAAALDRLAEHGADEAAGGGEEQPRFRGAATEVAATVWQHCVTEIDGEPVLTSSATLEGDAAVYDDPVLSLGLLPFFGFCAPDDPVWRGTMDYLRSERYPLWRTGAVPGLASRSQPARAHLAALCTDLLGPHRDDALERLRQLRLPAGLAAALYDPATGDAHEPHDAALAGFLARALVQAAEPDRKSPTRRGRARGR